MRMIGFFLILSLGLGCSTGNKERRERAALHLQIGTGYLERGLYPQAMTELIKAEQLDGENPFILNNLGITFYLRGKLTQAEKKFRDAVRLEPRFSEAKNNLARALIDQKKIDEAIPILRQVEGDLTYANPEKTYANLGMAYFEKGNFNKAEEYLSHSMELRRESCTTANFYGRTLLETKQISKSASVLDQAIEFCRASKFEDPLYFSAMSYFTLGEKEKTRARLEELLKDYPQSKYVSKAKGMLELLEQ